MHYPQHKTPLHMARVNLRGRGAQPVYRLHSVFLGGALVEVQAPMAQHLDLTLDLVHPAVGNIAINVRVAWCRPVQGSPHPLAALEFHSSWDGLVTLRHQLAAELGNRVFSGPKFVGYVLQEPNDPAQSCFDVSTAKIALIGTTEDGGFYVRRRDMDPTQPLPAVRAFDLALQIAFELSHPPQLNVPGPPIPEPTKEEKPKAVDPLEEELLGMNTIVLRPDKIDTESEILGMNTVVLGPDTVETDKDKDDSRVLGGGRHFGPATARFPHSKVMVAGDVAAYVSPSAAEGSWNLYGVNGKKLALLALLEGVGVQVCLMGAKPDDSLEFLQAKTCMEALVLALELEGQPTVEPALEGFT